jgi:hypothetical protein
MGHDDMAIAPCRMEMLFVPNWLGNIRTTKVSILTARIVASGARLIKESDGRMRLLVGRAEASGTIDAPPQKNGDGARMRRMDTKSDAHPSAPGCAVCGDTREGDGWECLGCGSV